MFCFFSDSRDPLPPEPVGLHPPGSPCSHASLLRPRPHVWLPGPGDTQLSEVLLCCPPGIAAGGEGSAQQGGQGRADCAVPAVETFSDLAFGDIFLHLLTGNLALLAEEFALEDFCSSLFDGFLLTASPRYGWGQAPLGRVSLRRRGAWTALQPTLWPLAGRRTCSAMCCGSSSTCTTAWRPPGCRPCRRCWSPAARWVLPLPCTLGDPPDLAWGLPTPFCFPQSGEAVKELYSQLSEKLEQLDHQKPSPAPAAEAPALELPLPAVPALAGL